MNKYLVTFTNGSTREVEAHGVNMLDGAVTFYAPSYQSTFYVGAGQWLTIELTEFAPQTAPGNSEDPIPTPHGVYDLVGHPVVPTTGSWW